MITINLFFVLDESYDTHNRDEIYRLILNKNPLVIVVCGFGKIWNFVTVIFNLI